MTVDEHIALLSENWFLTQPVLYGVLCMLRRVPNPRIECPVRVGQGRLEYNPLILAHRNYQETEVLFRAEMIRLLMGHPYQRKPEGASDEIVALGSNITLGDNYCFVHSKDKLPLQTPEAYHLPLGMPYEWYVHELQQKEEDNRNENPNPSDNENQNGNPNSQLSALWQEEPLLEEQLNTFLDHISDWGQMPAELVERIHIARQAKMRPMDIFRGFQAQVLGSKRVLTRTRPNRRTGYLQMGSRRTYTARVLVAIDVSCSVRTEDLERFYSVLNRLFRQQVAQLDVCTFDTVVSDPVPMQRTAKDIQIIGRGGTCYQPVLDFVSPPPARKINEKINAQIVHCPIVPSYDALIILTDGLAPAPVWQSARHPHLLWVLTSPSNIPEGLRATGTLTHLCF